FVGVGMLEPSRYRSRAARCPLKRGGYETRPRRATGTRIDCGTSGGRGAAHGVVHSARLGYDGGWNSLQVSSGPTAKPLGPRRDEQPAFLVHRGTEVLAHDDEFALTTAKLRADLLHGGVGGMMMFRTLGPPTFGPFPSSPPPVCVRLAPGLIPPNRDSPPAAKGATARRREGAKARR